MLLSLPLLWAALASAKCYEPDVAHPLPDYEARDKVLQQAFVRINTALAKAVAAPEFASTSFSVEITSSKESLWSQHHTARERNASRPDIPEVNGDALYRIASITKTFTVLGILQQHKAGNLNLDDPIDTYIGDLRGRQKGSIPWKDITLRSLASQLSGIPREFAQGDIINTDKLERQLPYDPVDLGFPPVSREGLPQCDEYALNYDPPCGAVDLINAVKAKPPLFAPNQKSSYSNVAFELLGLAIENVTNQTYESYITEAIFKPLDMKKSTISRPPDDAGVIPLDPQYWGVDEGIQNPTGGIYSSTTDMSKYLRYILAHYNGLTSSLNWAHPVSFAEGVNSFYGIPWEIFRTDRILANSRRPVRFITKSGGVPGYTSIIVMVPEYDLGITILVAGNSNLLSKILETVTVEAVRAAEEVAIRQLQERYAATYISTSSHLNSSITLVADHRGLIVKEFISNGTDVLNGALPSLAGPQTDGPWYIQIIPTLLYRNETEQAGERWRMLLIAERVQDDLGIWDDFCSTNIDGPGYGGLPINELVFWEGRDTVFDKVELTGFRANLTRTEDGSGTVTGHDEDITEL